MKTESKSISIAALVASLGVQAVVIVTSPASVTADSEKKPPIKEASFTEGGM